MVRPDELGASEEKLWREFQDLSPATAHPCLSLDYARAVCRMDESGRVAVAEDGGEVCAFLPYSLEGDRMAATLGGTQTAVDGLVSSGAPVDLRAVVRGAGLRGWRFSRAPAGQHLVDPFRYQGSYHTNSVYFADLRDGYDGYKRGLTRSGRDQLASAGRRWRAFERASGHVSSGDVSFEWDSRDPSHLSLLLKWKSEAYPGFGKWLSDPANRALVREIASADGEGCSALTSVLYVAAKPVSIGLNLWRGPVLSQWIGGFDPEYSSFSPGTNHMLMMFAAAVERGVGIIDFGYGSDPYKHRFASGVDTVGGGGVWASRLGGAARALYRKARFRDGG